MIPRPIYIKLTVPNRKRQGPEGPCLFCKAVCILRIHKPKWNGPGQAGKLSAYPYYSTSQHFSARKRPRFWRNSKDLLPEFGQFDRICLFPWHGITPGQLLCGFLQEFRPTLRVVNCVKFCIPAFRGPAANLYPLPASQDCLAKQKGPDKPVLCFLKIQNWAEG